MKNTLYQLLFLLCFCISCPLIGAQNTLTISNTQANDHVAVLFYQERNMHKLDAKKTPLTFSGTVLQEFPLLEEPTSAPASQLPPRITSSTPASSSQQGTPFLSAAAALVTTMITCKPGEQRIPCKYCEATFEKESYLKTHMKVHLGEDHSQTQE